MHLFGLKLGRLATATGTPRRTSLQHTYAVPLQGANPQVSIAPIKNQEVDALHQDDLLGEADVYWTYGKWHDAMQIYEWWIGNYGVGISNDVARKYLDCAAKAMDFEAFYRMMRKLIDQNVDRVFLQDMAVFGIMRDPSNFDLIGIAEEVNVDESRIISIAQKVWIPRKHRVSAKRTSGNAIGMMRAGLQPAQHPHISIHVNRQVQALRWLSLPMAKIMTAP
jgi:hypothetical protein